MNVTESGDATAWFLLVGGIIALSVGLFGRWRQVNFPRHWVADVVRVVDKRNRSESSEDGTTECWLLACTRDENGQPVSGEILVEVSHEAWLNTEINQEIKVYHKDGDLGDVRPASGAPASHAYRVILLGAFFTVIGASRFLHQG